MTTFGWEKKKKVCIDQYSLYGVVYLQAIQVICQFHLIGIRKRKNIYISHFIDTCV